MINVQRLIGVCALAFMCCGALCVEFPVALDKRFTIELVAQEPEIVTPTGVAVDARGRIWVLENNTHFTPKNYKGFGSDRIRILEDFEPNGHAKKITTFAEGFKNSMSLVLTADGGVIFATRSEIYSMREKDGVEDAAARKTIAKLDTAGNYPHNGLAGLAPSPDGLQLYFGLGENLGADYKLAGSDGVVLAGGGEGGNVYRCNLDGSKLEKIATGFWNPWGLGFDAAGRLFAVDNDPDSRPPCRLLHVVYGGDYGYKFKYGRKGTHPFQAWNGEIPGTLPMVAGTGEAPCAVYACEAPGLPKDIQGELLVTSWGDHVIQRYKLKPAGASFTALPEVLIKGGVDFRPVGLVPAPDGSLVVTDWVSSSYPVHGKGRVWRIRGNGAEKITSSAENRFKADSLYSDASLQALAAGADPENAIVPAMKTSDAFKFHAAVDALARTQSIEILQKYSKSSEAGVRLGVILALRKKKDVDSSRIHEILHICLTDDDPRVRRAAIQWVGEERIKELAPQLEKVLNLPMTRELFEAYLATKSLLSGDKPDKGEYIESQMAQIFPSDKHNAHVRALALKNLRVDHSGIKVEKLLELAADKAPELRAEAIKALAMQGAPQAQDELRKLCVDMSLSENIRADVIAGLARSAPSDVETQKVLLSFLEDGHSAALQREALRALRGAALEENIKKSVYVFAVKLPTNRVSQISELAEQAFFTLRLGGVTANDDLMGAAKLVPRRPGNEIEWMEYLSKPDPNDSVESGARIFYHVRGVLCSGCHRVNGRGGMAGPDLTAIGRTVVKEKIVQSILDPARDVAPQFVPWMFILKDGRRVTGTIIEENNGMVLVGENATTSTKLKLSDVELRAAQKGSVMPEQLADSLTQQEMRDLLAFLTANDR